MASPGAPPFTEGGEHGESELRARAVEPADPELATQIEAAPIPSGFPSGIPSADRYQIIRKLGEGGMATVYLARDANLERLVAMKVMRSESPPLQDRFLREIQILSQLEHPNVVPLYDIVWTDRRVPVCVMRYLRGRSLEQVIAEIKEDAPEGREYSLTRLMQIFLQITQAIEYAHSKRIIHRDLKPANIMLGEHGEVQVVDWGLGKIVRSDEGSGRPSLNLTSQDEILGTPAYMAPEQIGSARTDERTDVYALGVILYELLTLCRPIQSSDRLNFLQKLLVEKPVRPRELCPDRLIPTELEQACLRALEKDPAKRQQSARDLRNQVQAWLEAATDAAKRHALAESKVQEGRSAFAEYERTRLDLQRLLARVNDLSHRYANWQSVRDKAPLYRAEDQVTAARRRLSLLQTRVVGTLTEALGFERAHAGARELLADYYHGLWREAELARESDRAHYYERLVAEYHDGKYATELAGVGKLQLTCDVPNATATLYAVEEEDLQTKLRYLPETLRLDGTPLELPMGSYVVVVGCEGYREVRYPVAITRNSLWEGPVHLYREDEIGPGFAQVAGGPFLEGGDPGTSWSMPRSEPWVDDFAIARYPVTLGEYLEFLRDLATVDVEAARSRAPRRTPDGGAYVEIGPTGEIAPVSKRSEEMPSLDLTVPVFGVSWFDAQAYCEWRSRRDGLDYRLPTSREWEKAARGVDGRWFPWGSRFDASLCNTRESRRDNPAIASIHEFETDVSVYGVYGMAGNVRDWTCTEERQGEGQGAQVFRVVRGGAWYGGRMSARVADRFWFEPGHVYFFVGFRLAHSLAPRQSGVNPVAS